MQERTMEEEETPKETALRLGGYSDSQRERWRIAGLLVRALADDPDADAVMRVFQLPPATVRAVGPSAPADVERARPALGRAIRKVMLDGGPEITDPAEVLAMFTAGRRPNHGEVPYFRGGEPVEAPPQARAVGG